ncbi:MAG: CoA-binding protein [Candidatus Lokiarchaeota archaeon]|nr:CoA-binding protein [Candidatus Lokiarchaeota archaeon]
MDIEEKLELMKVLFNPKNVAIVGATDNMIKIGSRVFGSVLSCGFTKNLYGINPSPKYENKRIFGKDIYPSLDKCPEPIDLVGIVVPPYAVIDSVKQAIENGVRTAAIITAGFGEVKTEVRQEENKELVKIAQKGGLIFVGPNSMGFYSSEDKTSPLHLGFGFMMPRPGNLSIVSQSGTMGTVLCNAFQNIRYFVSSGNEASLTLEDYLEYYARDSGTKTIALFAEGLRAGSRFKEICAETTKKKPIIFLKAGTTKTGARAANSHTGSIAGSLDIYQSLFKQTGVISADQIEQFIYLVKGAQYLLPLPTNGRLRVGIVSGGGGFVVHLTDLCEKHGLNVVDLRTEPNGPKLIEDISKHLPFYWSHNNPVDMVATGNPNVYKTVTELMLNSDCFDVIITMSSLTFLDRMKLLKPINEIGKKMAELMKLSASDRHDKAIKYEIELNQKFPNKRIIYISFGNSLESLSLEKYDENKIMVFGGNPENAAVVLKKLHRYQLFINAKP